MRFLFLLWCKPLWCALFLLATTLSHAAQDSGAKRTLYVCTRPGTFPKKVMKRFEKEFGCRVEIDEFDTNDIMLEHIDSSGCGYDVIVAPAGMAEKLYDDGLLQPLNHNLLPNLRHVASRVLDMLPDRRFSYQVPYFITCIGVAYNKDMVPEEYRGSWTIFGAPGFTKKAAMLNDMRFSLAAALKTLGYSANSVNPEEVRAAGDLLQYWKRNIAYFSRDKAWHALIEKELAFIQTYSWMTAPVSRDDPNIGFFIPKEGGVMATAALIIPADAQQKDLAHAFLNFLHAPQTAAEIMDSTLFFMPNPEGRKGMNPAARASGYFTIPYETVIKSESIIDVDDAIEYYDEAWLDMLLDGDGY